jgi:acetylxylan esterase
MTRYLNYMAALSTFNASLLFAGGASAGSWQDNAPFGAALQGNLYTPTTPAASPAVLVVIHMCTGHSSTVKGWFDSYADKYGFYLIAPDAGKQCFDSSATRDGDRAAIVKMVDYVITNKSANKSRVFAAGMSSGGCMTNTLLAIYPDTFVGGSAMPGFPAGAWPAGDIVCSKCGSSPPSTDGKFWGDMARKAFSWSGTYPCSQQWVGGGDQYNFNGWLPAVAAQFQNLGNLGSGAAGTGAPNGWTRTVYKDAAGNVRLQTNLGPSSQAHDLENVGPTFLYGAVISFLGLDQSTGACGIATTGGADGGGPTSGGSDASTDGRSSGAGGTSTNGGGGSATPEGGMGGAMGGTGGSVVNTGGAMNAGGMAGTGGSMSGTGGTSSSSGMPAGTGGSSGAPTESDSSVMGSSGSGGESVSGCGCRMGGGDDRTVGQLLAMLRP